MPSQVAPEYPEDVFEEVETAREAVAAGAGVPQTVGRDLPACSAGLVAHVLALVSLLHCLMSLCDWSAGSRLVRVSA